MVWLDVQGLGKILRKMVIRRTGKKYMDGPFLNGQSMKIFVFHMNVTE